MNDTLIHRRVAAARERTNPAVIARMRSGWAVDRSSYGTFIDSMASALARRTV